ncbi:hypothetical protein HFP15_29320 [Amycolatopsis sp. K13G38]|uniref:Uncharacterized protein n=1 Tax=Amycolatopsis acididurans TaxID=2724524 RepID=A0ABX1JB33_9PSEU|nr:hypothetical protein [Amycolatopsis acididurans]NKQ56976.1 hypothetical protein [Amycolatopsis acididurans]
MSTVDRRCVVGGFDVAVETRVREVAGALLDDGDGATDVVGAGGATDDVATIGCAGGAPPGEEPHAAAPRISTAPDSVHHIFLHTFTAVAPTAFSVIAAREHSRVRYRDGHGR